MQSSLRQGLLLCAVVLAITACGSAAKNSTSESKSAQELVLLMDEAAALEKSGQKVVSLQKYADVTKIYPASKLPWLKIAQIHYDAMDYGQAIVAAQQVIARDDSDKLANSILSVSALRIATKSLSDLKRQNELTGTVRADAQQLANTLRESLGERVLVPAPGSADVSKPAQQRAPVAAVPVAPVPRPALVKPSTPSTGGSPAASPSAGTSAGSGAGPFGALK